MSRPGRPRGEEGSATLLVLWTALLVLATAVALGAVAVVRVTRARAASAADLSALAGAAAYARGEDACAAARDLAVRSGAVVTRCSPRDGVVLVDVAVALPGRLADWGPVRARAVAGPVDAMASG